MSGEPSSTLLPSWLMNCTFMNYVLLIGNSSAITVCADPVSSGKLLDTVVRDWHLMRQSSIWAPFQLYLLR